MHISCHSHQESSLVVHQDPPPALLFQNFCGRSTAHHTSLCRADVDSQVPSTMSTSPATHSKPAAHHQIERGGAVLASHSFPKTQQRVAGHCKKAGPFCPLPPRHSKIQVREQGQTKGARDKWLIHPCHVLRSR